MPLPRLSLQALEAFERVAQSGSVQAAAQEMGLSISSVSHHLARLEDQLGTSLFDRATRPFTLTREGREALRHLSPGLVHLRRATSATAIGGLIGTRSLRVGIVEDFESGVAPDLAVALARQMPRANLSQRTILSHEAPALLRASKLDIAIGTRQLDPQPSLTITPILRDPFVIAAPINYDETPQTLLSGRTALPFLRFNPDHLIGAQIAGHLARCKIDLPERFAFDSAQSIMAIIAGEAGWAVLTPLGYFRAQRFIRQVALHPLPIPDFARQIVLMTRTDFDPRVSSAVAGLLHQAIDREVLQAVHSRYDWLRSGFVLTQPSG